MPTAKWGTDLRKSAWGRDPRRRRGKRNRERLPICESDRSLARRRRSRTAREVSDDWLEEVAAGTRIRRDRRKYLPERVSIDRLGRESSEQDGDAQLVAHFVRSPFRFCLACGVSHAARQGDYTKLATLGAGGLSSATTVLSLAAIKVCAKRMVSSRVRASC